MTLLALALWACTGEAPDDTGSDDTGDSGDTADTTDTADTGITARFGVRGEAVVDVGDGTWVGTTSVYDVLVDGTGAVTETLCELHFTSTGTPATPCASCTFAFAVAHLEATGQTGAECDDLWPPNHPGRLPSSWDGTLGYHPTGADDDPALMTWIDAYTDDGGTFHPAAWEATPRPDQPYGGATWNETTGAFTFDRPMRTYTP